MEATTYTTAIAELERLGARPVHKPFVVDGGVPTASRCLNGDKLALWIITKLVEKDVTEKVYGTVKPLE